jgi:hypothetical protein
MKVYKLLKKWWFEIGTDMYRDILEMLFICNSNEMVIEHFNSYDMALLITILTYALEKFIKNNDIYQLVLNRVRDKIKVFNLFNYFTAHHMRTEKDCFIQNEINSITDLFKNKLLYKHLKQCIWQNTQSKTITLYCFCRKLFSESNSDYKKLMEILFLLY